MSQKRSVKRSPADGHWEKGTSGNPAGRPPGSRNKSTVFFEALLNGHAEALLDKAIQLALQGDTAALRLCLERICPPRKERTIDLPLPKVTSSQGIAAALASIVTAVGEGRITPGEAESLARVLESQIGIVEMQDLAQRVAELERARPGPPQTIQPCDGSTLDWISRNYSDQTPGSGTEARRTPAEPAQGNGPETDSTVGPAAPLVPPAASTTTSEPRGKP